MRKAIGWIGFLALFIAPAWAADPEPGSDEVRSRRAAARERFEYARDPGRLVLRYHEDLGELAGPDAGPSLEIYGDGRTLVHYPPYMQRAGTYESTLDETELADLLADMVDRDVVDVDVADLRRRRRESIEQRRAARDPSLLHDISDESTLTLEIHLERYTPRTPGAAARRNFSRTIRYPGLRGATHRHPEIPELQALTHTQADLRALMSRQAAP